MRIYIRVELDDEHDMDLLSRIIKDIEKIKGVLEVYPIAESAQQGVQADEVPRCTCKAGTGGHASWCELEKYWAVLRR